MYCAHCGKYADNDSIYCNNCGTRLKEYRNMTETDKNENLGFTVLGFFVPLAGLILFLIYIDQKPQRAKSAGKGALIGFITIISLILLIVISIIIFGVSLVNHLNG